MKKPLVSIIIPVYNGSNYLREAINSALAQTYKNIEIIVVNDGSNDNGETERVALSYGERIRYFYKDNGGSSSALNYGIQKMKGDYFSWLSHDDMYKPDKIEKQVQKISAVIHKKQIVICGFELINVTGEHIPYPKKQLDGNFTYVEMFNKLTSGYGINGCGVLVPKEVMNEVGFFDENFKYVNDTDYWYRLMLNKCHFTCFDEQLVLSRVHNEQVTIKKAELFKTESIIMSRKIFSQMFEAFESNLDIIKLYLRFVIKNGELSVANEVIYELNRRGYNQYRIQIYLLFVYGRIIRLLKEIYKKLFFRR
ncbi:MAG: glycosyltransferase [Clostridia bacterium]|nr:glycosyltransferase [Clostridia bacterium]